MLEKAASKLVDSSKVRAEKKSSKLIGVGKLLDAEWYSVLFVDDLFNESSISISVLIIMDNFRTRIITKEVDAHVSKK